MKKWMEWLLENQVTNLDWDSQVQPTTNLYDVLGPAFERIVQNYNNGTMPARFFNIIMDDNHIQRQAVSTKGALSEEQYRDFLYEHRAFLDGMGHQYITNFGEDHRLIVDTVSERFKLRPDTIEIRIQIELSGQYFVMHIDRSGKSDAVKKPHLTFLQDQSLGHIFMFGHKTYNWKKGDSVSWNYNVPHGSVNIGYEPKFMLVTLGVPIDDKNFQ